MMIDARRLRRALRQVLRLRNKQKRTITAALGKNKQTPNPATKTARKHTIYRTRHLKKIGGGKKRPEDSATKTRGEGQRTASTILSSLAATSLFQLGVVTCLLRDLTRSIMAATYAGKLDSSNQAGNRREERSSSRLQDRGVLVGGPRIAKRPGVRRKPGSQSISTRGAEKGWFGGPRGGRAESFDRLTAYIVRVDGMIACNRLDFPTLVYSCLAIHHHRCAINKSVGPPRRTAGWMQNHRRRTHRRTDPKLRFPSSFPRWATNTAKLLSCTPRPGHKSCATYVPKARDGRTFSHELHVLRQKTPGWSHFWTENKRCLLLKAATTFTAGLSLLSLKLVSAAIQPSALAGQQTKVRKHHRGMGGVDELRQTD